ncbi:MAG: hypothetical protein WC527_00785 [Candidatus Margulisiibacteriota bacterium]
MSSKEERCPSCNKLLMKEGEIKCPRCKEVVAVGTPCEFFEACPHRRDMSRYGTVKKLLNTLPVAMKERMRLSNYQ